VKEAARLRKSVQTLSRIICYGGMILLIPMMLLTTGDVIGRAFWNRPIPGTLELSSYMLAVFILSGLAFTNQVKGHVRVEMLVVRLPDRLRALMEIITTTLSLFIIVVVAWQGFVLGAGEKAVSDMLRIPQWPFKLLVCLGGSTLALELLLDLCESIKRITRK
jgi:TRAP-type C4-dicarboxylate transport system permease small subunit